MFLRQYLRRNYLLVLFQKLIKGNNYKSWKGQQRKKDNDYVFFKKIYIYIVVVFRKKWFTESYYIYRYYND